MEDSLMSLEKLDRSSPDLWPEQIPGVYNFTPVMTPLPSPSQSALLDFDETDYALLYQLANMSPAEIIGEVKRLQTVAYQLGVEESKEMTRGKYLHVLNKRID